VGSFCGCVASVPDVDKERLQLRGAVRLRGVVAGFGGGL